MNIIECVKLELLILGVNGTYGPIRLAQNCTGELQPATGKYAIRLNLTYECIMTEFER